MQMVGMCGEQVGSGAIGNVWRCKTPANLQGRQLISDADIDCLDSSSSSSRGRAPISSTAGGGFSQSPFTLGATFIKKEIDVSQALDQAEVLDSVHHLLKYGKSVMQAMGKRLAMNRLIGVAVEWVGGQPEQVVLICEDLGQQCTDLLHAVFAKQMFEPSPITWEFKDPHDPKSVPKHRWGKVGFHYSGIRVVLRVIACCMLVLHEHGVAFCDVKMENFLIGNPACLPDLLNGVRLVIGTEAFDQIMAELMVSGNLQHVAGFAARMQGIALCVVQVTGSIVCMPVAVCHPEHTWATACVYECGPLAASLAHRNAISRYIGGDVGDPPNCSAYMPVCMFPAVRAFCDMFSH